MVVRASFALLAYIASNPVSATAEIHRAPPELLVRRHIIESQQRLTSLEIVYLASSLLDSAREPEDSAREPEEGDAIIRCSMMMKRPIFLLHDASKVTTRMPWSEELSRQSALLTDGHFILDLPVNRLYVTGSWKPAEGLPGSLKGEMFFTVTGIWPFDDCRAPTPFGHPHVLKDVAKSDDFIVAAQAETIGDHKCVLMTSKDGSDILWLDMERGYSLVKRVIRNKRFNAVAAVFLADDFCEYEGGIWIPTRFEHRYFKCTSPLEDERGVCFMHAEATATKIAVNSVDENAFTFHARPGALHYSSDNLSAPPIEAVRGSNEHLEAMADWIKLTSRSESRSKRQIWPILGAGLALGLTSSVLAAFRWRRNRLKSSVMHEAVQ